MFRLFRRKKHKKPEQQNQESEKNKYSAVSKDIPVSHLMVNWNPMLNRDTVKARHPHMVTGYIPHDKMPKWENEESRE